MQNRVEGYLRLEIEICRQQIMENVHMMEEEFFRKQAERAEKGDNDVFSKIAMSNSCLMRESKKLLSQTLISKTEMRKVDYRGKSEESVVANRFKAAFKRDVKRSFKFHQIMS